MNGNMEFRRARREEAEEILQLYRSLIGTEYYPISFFRKNRIRFYYSKDMLEPVKLLWSEPW